LLARLHGWNKIVFLDDDITISRLATLRASRRNWTGIKWPE
jgi:hypothetical protein